MNMQANCVNKLGGKRSTHRIENYKKSTALALLQILLEIAEGICRQFYKHRL